MSVSKTVRNPNGLATGNGGYALKAKSDGSAQILQLLDSGGSALVSFTDTGADGTGYPVVFGDGSFDSLFVDGNVEVSGISDLNDRVTIIKQSDGNALIAALDVHAAPDGIGPIANFRNSAGVIKALVLSDGSFYCKGDAVFSDNNYYWGPTNGAGLSGTYFDNNGVMQRVSGLTAGQAIRVNGAATGFEAYNPTTGVIFTQRVNSVSLTAVSGTETVIFQVAQSNFFLSRAIIRCRQIDTTSSAIINIGQAGVGALADTELTTITLGNISSNTMYQVIYPRNPSGGGGASGAQALAAGTNYVVRVGTAASGGGGTCLVDVIVEGFYLAL